MKRETQSFYEHAVARAIAHVVSHLDQALDLERLARQAALSPFHFHRIFRGMIGETPLELHRRLRLERAAFRLATDEDSVTTIAFEAGYDTHEAFTRAFRGRYGASPSEFRDSVRVTSTNACTRPPQIELAARSGIHFHPNAGAEAFAFVPMQGELMMNVAIQDLKELRVATLRHVGPYNRISEAFGRLGSVAGPAGLFVPPMTMLALYHDDPETTAEAELRSDAGVVVTADAAIPSALAEQRIPAGRYAVATHVGPYEQLGDAWSRLMGQWLPASGERLGDGVTFEIYRNTPMDTPKEELRTELYVPLA